MGKVTVIVLNPDMTFKEKKVRTESKKLKIERSWKPSFTPGRSVFKEESGPRLKFWKRNRNLIITLHEAEKAFELHDSSANELDPSYWTRKETQKFIAQLVAKSKAQQKVISTSHFIIIMVALGIIGVFQFLMMKGMRIF